MEELLTILRPEERIALQLRELYEHRHFHLFRLSSFEEYDLYLQNKAFLTNVDPITFTGNNGRLMALNPDVTLSIVKNTPIGEARRVYYNEDVYRHDRKDGEYKRINQIGLELIGKIDSESEAEVVQLAMESLAVAGKGALDISHIGLVEDIVEQFAPYGLQKKALMALQTKSPHTMQAVCQQAGLSEPLTQALTRLTAVSGPFQEVATEVELLVAPLPKAAQAMVELNALYDQLQNHCSATATIDVRLDFSFVNDTDYYSGLLFQGFLEGIPHAVLFGGRYDHLLKAHGAQQGAIGFGMYLNGIDRKTQQSTVPTKSYLDIALPKGRMGNAIYQKLVKAGLVSAGLFDDSRKLIFQDDVHRIRFFLVKPSDVDQYVDRGAADIGVVGLDVLLEGETNVLEVLDLKIGKCKMVVAGKSDFQPDSTRPLRVATKYPQITRHYYNDIRQPIELIELHGSIELAPLLDLSDVIVDIVETGTTLKENHLIILQEFLESSARLIVNPVSWRFKEVAIQEFIQKVGNDL
ncbi:ATP phosphoribosyltransferase [Enterococcus sp. 8G7_MSG3316]|uniref:ATP phosphoribosyltransferase n=1 Tax=Candidatus Enterococcus testudinis TaxID=1834191 RepID=A0A242A6C4_9ENTE|nr:ATP phosphoribosyltransferase [Enterococcus sp. 8G7_MSG3316]OTN76163.1 ATP phosphoribosyltransferase [Enterococcus sp. 8G7_MSG3316]